MDKDQLQRLRTSLKNLKDAFSECGEAIGEMDETEVNRYICPGYPFKQSFADLVWDVINWQFDADKKLNDALNPSRKKYRVYATMTQHLSMDVYAESREQAQQIAAVADEDSFVKVADPEWEISHSEEAE